MPSEMRATVFQIICCAFCIIVATSNIISAKMAVLPFLPDFAIPAGLITYPLTFFLSDLVTELFGPQKARLMVYTALAMNLLCLGIIHFSLSLPAPKDEYFDAYNTVMGLSGLRIFSSLAAYVLSQIVAIYVYDLIKRKSNLPFLWMRNNGSNCIAQLTDTVAIDIIYLFWGLGMAFKTVWPIMVFSYVYKLSFSVILTPLYCAAAGYLKKLLYRNELINP